MAEQYHRSQFIDMNGVGMLKLLPVVDYKFRDATGILLLLSHSAAPTSESDTQASRILR